jgi:glycosyltransferase involved in cell wall biosynthesis
MRALLFTNLFPSPHQPTRALFNLRRFQALSEFCGVRVVAPVPFRSRLAVPRELLRPRPMTFGGLTVTYPTNWTVPRLLPQFHAAEMYRSVRPHVRALRREFPFDAILAVFAYPDVAAAARVAAECGVPFVAMVVGSDINELAQRPSLRPAIGNALREANSVIAVSRALRDRVIELGVPASRVIVQYNGVDGEYFRIRDKSEARAALGLTDQDEWVCFVGNLVPEKGPDVLVAALGYFRSLSPRVPNVALIGDGPLMHDLSRAAASVGMERHIRFLGRLPPEKVALWLSASDVLCLPSRREGCPNVLLEALASGRPVVGSAVGGVPELLSDETGLLVVPDNPSALAAGLEQALAREWAAARLRSSVPALSWTRVGETIYDALRNAVEGRGQS